MAKNTEYSKSKDYKSGVTVRDFPYITSWYQKSKSDFALAKELAMYYHGYFNRSYLDDRLKKYEENANLYNGRWPEIENYGNSFDLSLGGENVNIDGPKLRHFPVIDRVAKAIVSENAMRPLKPLVVDMSTKASNARKRNKLKKISQYLQDKVVEPIRREQTMLYMQQNNIGDMAELNPQEREQAMQEVEQRVQRATPEDVNEAIASYRTPEEKQLQLFLDYSMNRYDIKNKLDLGYENAVQFGEEYYRLHIHNDNNIHFETLNPKYVVWGGSEHTEFVEDAEFARYEQFLSPSEVISRYGKYLKKSQIKRLEQYYGPFPTSGRGKRGTDPSPQIERRIIETIADNPQIQDGLDAKTKEGQRRIADLYKNVTPAHNRALYGIRESYVTFKWARKLKCVKSVVDGEIREDIYDEHYEFSPLSGDIEMREIYADEAWHAVILGEDEIVYCEPLPYQNRSLEDPFGAKLSIYGCTYNTLMNNSRNLSLIDNGKPWQYKYNAQIRRLEEYEATNIGKVMVGTSNMRPDSFSWQEFYKSGRYLKFLPINPNQEHLMGGNANALFRSVDLSNMVDIAAALQQLDAYENRIITSMYYNPSKLGEPSPYLTSGNNAANIQASDKQLYRYFNRHRQVTQRVLNGFVNLARIAFKDSELRKSVLLDDFSRAELEINADMFNTMEIGIFVLDDFFENQKIDFLRQQLLPLIQNQYGSMKDFIKLINAKSMSEMMSIAESAERKADARMQQQQEAQAEAIQQQSESQKDLMDFKNNLDMARDQAVQEYKMQIAKIDAEKFALQYDIDRDGVNDLNYRADKEAESRIRVQELKNDIDKYKIDRQVEMNLKMNKEKIKASNNKK